MTPLLTILIPCIPSRWDKVIPLVDKIQSQIDDFFEPSAIELIVLVDNKSRTIGEKREALKSLVRGTYFCMIDDDDDVMDSFVDDIASFVVNDVNDVDVVSFDSLTDIEGKQSTINMSIHNPDNEQWKPDTIVKRKPWHMCAWKTSKFQSVSFGLNMYGEDAPFMKGANEIVTNEHHIDKSLHIYKWRADVTEAFERE